VLEARCVDDRGHLGGAILGRGDSRTGSERPVPALSKMATRANAARRSKKVLMTGLAQNRSRFDTNEGTTTNSTSPEPKTW
jgi:hypothetical protein